jgi:mannose-1-phosphate guanylyltransferase
VELAPDGRIHRFQEKPRPEEAVSTTANTGIYIFEPEVLDLVPGDRPFDIGGDLFPLLAAQEKPFYGIALPFNWLDIGTTPDYWRATQAVLRGEVDIGGMPGRALGPGVWGGINVDADWDHVQGPVYVGAGSRIERGARVVGPTVIGRNCVIEKGALVESSIIGNYTRVSGLAHLRDRIVSGRFCVDREGRNVELASTGYAFVIDDVRERRRWTDEQRAVMEFLQMELPPGD